MAKHKKEFDTQRFGIIAAIVVACVAVVLLVLKFAAPSQLSPSLAAKVNGVGISQADIDKQYNSLPAYYQQMLTKEAFINQSIARELLLQEAKAQGLTVSQQDLDLFFTNLRAQSGLTEEELLTRIQDANITMEELREEYRKQLLVSKLLNSTVYPRLEVSQSEVADYYTNNPQQFEQVRASHILVATQESADELLAKLRAGADFATVAKAYSTDTGSAQEGGDLGFFTATMMVPEFSEAAFSLTVGQLSEPVQTQFGWHIIKVTARKKIPFDDAKEDIAQGMMEERQPAAVSAYIDSLWKKAKIEIY